MVRLGKRSIVRGKNINVIKYISLARRCRTFPGNSIILHQIRFRKLKISKVSLTTLQAVYVLCKIKWPLLCAKKWPLLCAM